jgi:predicted Rossmann fold nucleotide-binding protein DprA/Smf involved in DNA uptake
MKLAIVGSRNFSDYKVLSDFILSKFNLSEVDAIVSGGAKGADSLAEKFAHEHNLLLIVKEADWAKYGRAAGPIRNQLIVDEAAAVVAFPTPSSKGTLSTMNLATKKGKRLEVMHVPDDTK